LHASLIILTVHSLNSPIKRHRLGHKAGLSKYKKTEITPCILSGYNAVTLELKNKSNSRKYANNWRLNSTWLSDQWVIEEIREKINRFLEVNENEKPSTRTYGIQKRQS
jgi:hypothetical protein